MTPYRSTAASPYIWTWDPEFALYPALHMPIEMARAIDSRTGDDPHTEFPTALSDLARWFFCARRGHSWHLVTDNSPAYTLGYRRWCGCGLIDSGDV